MKSIKEKAEELVENSIELSREESIIYYQGIEQGANYVLDVIADVINQPMNDYLVLGELKKVIKQLKK